MIITNSNNNEASINSSSEGTNIVDPLPKGTLYFPEELTRYIPLKAFLFK
jgi:hypothetical protein